ncbi:hypothetical protein HHX47_DHR7000746 [Lentinula edodes]|nr:hypothetical protein HHX47_DHR7000746 [Lentinula edodes]
MSAFKSLHIAFKTLDVKDVGYVIANVHRVGRTGRAGKKGTSFTYFTTENARSARELISILREAKSVVPPELEEMAMLGGGGGKGRYNSGRGGSGRGGGRGTGSRFGQQSDTGYGSRSSRW